jgi:hypothetical protein
VELKFTDVSDLGTISQTLDHINIYVADDFGNGFSKTITSSGGDVTFVHGDGGLQLNDTSPNGSYRVLVSIYTNECATGNQIQYDIAYTYSPCDDIGNLSGLASFADNNGNVINPISNQTINATAHPNGSITIQGLGSSLPSSHVFDKIDVLLEDDLIGSYIKTISSPTSSVTFTNGEGNLALDASNPNRKFSVTIILYTNLCKKGADYTFIIQY